MKEHGFFFDHKGMKLYGFFHPADLERKSEPVGYVFCSPFAEEKVRTQRMFVNFARWLAQGGIHVLRFDYGGHGDSEGEFQEATFRTQVEDIRRATDVLIEKSGVKKVGLLGGRLGGTLALLAAEGDPRVSDMVVWDPIIDVHQYLLKILRSNLSSQTMRYRKILYDRKRLEEMIIAGESVNVDGYELTRGFYLEAMNCHLIQDMRKYTGSCLIVEICSKELLKKPPLGELQETLKRTGECQYIKVSDSVFWETQRYYNPKPAELFKETFDWIKRQNGKK